MRDKFIKKLFEFCDNYVEIRPLPNAGDRRFFSTYDHEGINNFCDKQHKSNLFFGAASRDGVNGTKDNIINIPAVWTDLDFKDTPRTAARENLKKFPFKPSITILSGGGVHLYWLLKEPAEQSDISQVEDANRRIAIALDGDLNACDASRVLRIPDTLNHKYKPARKVECVDINDFQYSLDDFTETLPEINHTSTNTRKANPEGWLLEALKGVTAHTPGRDATGAKIAGYFINKLPARDITTILLAWNVHNEPPLPEADIFKILNSVNRYKNGEKNNASFKRIAVSIN